MKRRHCTSLRSKRPALPLLLALGGLGACAHPGAAPRTAPPRDGLTGRIYDARAKRFISEQQLVQQLSQRRLVLLGERHDNPEHHRIQARILRGLVQAGRRPAVTWEMLTDAEAGPLKRFLARPSVQRTAARLGPALHWHQRGWPPWPLYQPVAEVALAAQLPLLPAGIGGRELMVQAHAALRAEQPPAPQLPPAALEALAEEVRESHCGHAPPRMVRMMVRAQQLRDAHMARRLLQAATPADRGAVLIAGNGHTRRDRGVPFHLRQQGQPERAIGSVGVVELVAGQLEPARYGAGTAGMGPAYDFVWFTPTRQREDPCVKFREQLQRMHRTHHGPPDSRPTSRPSEGHDDHTPTAD